MKLALKAADIIIIILVSVITFFAFFFVYSKQNSSAQVLIRAQNDEWIFPVDIKETVVVSGPLGDTVVRIENNTAWIESSPCDNQTCAASGLVSKQGQWTACLPNNVLLMIYGAKDKKDDIDTIVW